MYYILNQSDQIVAVDPQLLAQLDVENADEFYKKFALDEITFNIDDHTLTITSGERTYSFPVTINPLSGILGDLTLVDIDSTSPLPVEAEEDLITFSDEKVLLSNEKEIAPTEEEEPLFPSDEILFDLKDGHNDLLPEEKPKEKESGAEEELFELILPADADNAIAEITSPEETEKEDKNHTPIYIDVESISQMIGISAEDYTLFLNEYIDTALLLEEALQSQNAKEQNDAINKLSHLSNVLHLPFVNDLLEQVKHAPESERQEAIDAFFSTLGRLTTAHFEEEKATATDKVGEVPEIVEESTSEEGHRPPIDLSDVKPIHFDFQLEEAANDLNLPVELIEEFVGDFITQAHEETEKMLKAYEQGDLETVQKIGHLLKGTSSNLRITPLSDTLYEIQFNDDIQKVPELVKNYWGHFLSLENQFTLITNKGKGK